MIHDASLIRYCKFVLASLPRFEAARVIIFLNTFLWRAQEAAPSPGKEMLYLFSKTAMRPFGHPVPLEEFKDLLEEAAEELNTWIDQGAKDSLEVRAKIEDLARRQMERLRIVLEYPKYHEIRDNREGPNGGW